MTSAQKVAKTVMVFGILALWTGTITERPGLALLGCVLMLLVGLAALAGIMREVGA